MANSLSYGNIEWFWESISDYGFNFTSVVWVYSTEGYIDNNNNNNFDNTQLKAAASIGDHSLEPCMPLYSTWATTKKNNLKCIYIVIVI